MSYLTDPDIKAVMPPWGGDLAMELLDLIDFDLLSRSKPKWFVGFSDLSTLHFPLTMISGWATLHGPNLMDLGAQKLDATTQAVWEILESNRGTVIKQYSSTAFQADENQWGTASDGGFNLTQKTQWKRLDGVTSSLTFREGANKQVISSQADSLIKISRIWADFFPANTSNQPI